MRDITEASPQVRNAVDRAGRFLSLASLVSVLLCAIAVAMAARRYVNRHLDTVALLKTLGATRAFTLGVTVLQLAALALLAAVAGAVLGFLAQEWLLRTIRGLLAVTELPGPQLAPIGIGFLTALAVLAGFALPPLLQLARVPALRVLRRDVGPPPPLVILAFGPAVLVVLLLIYWTVPEPKLFAYFTAGLAAFVLALTAAGLLVVYLAGRLRGRVGVAWRFGVANLSRRRAESVVQLVAFGTGIMVLLLLGILRVDLNGDWQRTLPQNLPNYFFVNIPPAARDGVRAVPERAGRAHHQGPADHSWPPDGDQRQAGRRPEDRPRQRGGLRHARAEPHLVCRARRGQPHHRRPLVGAGATPASRWSRWRASSRSRWA